MEEEREQRDPRPKLNGFDLEGKGWGKKGSGGRRLKEVSDTVPLFLKITLVSLSVLPAQWRENQISFMQGGSLSLCWPGMQ